MAVGDGVGELPDCVGVAVGTPASSPGRLVISIVGVRVAIGSVVAVRLGVASGDSAGVSSATASAVEVGNGVTLARLTGWQAIKPPPTRIARNKPG
jgi:hypothetical protein